MNPTVPRPASRTALRSTPHPARRAAVVTAVLASAALLAGCSADAAATTDAEPSALFEQSIADLVPEDIAAAGEIRIASGPGYPPLLDLADDGTTLSGSQPEEMRLIGEVLGLDVVFEDIKFDALFPSLASNKIDAAAAALGVTAERLETVDFVSDFLGGTTLLVEGGNPLDLTIDTLCGQSVGVLKGSTENDITLPKWDAVCTEAGEPAIEISTFPTAADAVLALSSGRVDATVSAVPPAVFQAEQSDGALEALDVNFEPSPWGIAFPDGSELAPAFQAALEHLMTTGDYEENLERFGVEVGAVEQAELYTDPAQISG
ncbi:ABC transporter substrate-binding protein [Rathayibacter sp. VKM Ac-2927]|uniref:ABC transporter substrate-binding protein n=1 Tax=Rathayibacter sp. VKM Ac-2927 TaxID=2929478 RepID=UPI001FB2E7E3|nr:ABC transporter substrate-binding protein [Rathayibacter sp. VKM Ac-2927]MCJ1687156.1 ABC transporter substrate-binding protein [Rathayibacter sp. VKM Ac-2927]